VSSQKNGKKRVGGVLVALMFSLGGLVTRVSEGTIFTTDSPEESTGPGSLSYDVNMPSPNKNKKKSPSKANTRTRSTSRGRLSPEDSIAKILDLCKSTNDEVSKIRERLDITTTDITELKDKVADVQERLGKVESVTNTVTEKVRDLEDSQAAMEQRIEERLLARLEERGKSSPAYQPTVSQFSMTTKPVSQLLQRPRPKITHQEVGEDAYRKGGEAGKKIHDAFKELLKVAEARKQTFLVGVIENINEGGAQMRPLLNYKQFVERFFEGVRYEIGKLGLAQSTGLPLGRVTVHREDVHVMKMRIRDGWRGARDLGWWSGQENPMDLRQMETTAFRFIMETKTMCEGLRRFYLEVDEGFLRFQGAPFLPVYMVPADKSLWPELAEVLLKMVQSLRAVSWIDRFRHDLRKLDPGLLEEWNNIFRVTSDTEQGRRPNLALDDEIRVLGKLRAAGRGQRRVVSSWDSPKTPGLVKTPVGAVGTVVQSGPGLVGTPAAAAGAVEQRVSGDVEPGAAAAGAVSQSALEDVEQGVQAPSVFVENGTAMETDDLVEPTEMSSVVEEEFEDASEVGDESTNGIGEVHNF
jgi:hypothetical protein